MEKNLEACKITQNLMLVTFIQLSFLSTIVTLKIFINDQYVNEVLGNFVSTSYMLYHLEMVGWLVGATNRGSSTSPADWRSLDHFLNWSGVEGPLFAITLLIR